MSRYASGARFERDLINLLKDHGFDAVRAAGSKGKLAGIDCDLVATKWTDRTKYEFAMVIAQCKRTRL